MYFSFFLFIRIAAPHTSRVSTIQDFYIQTNRASRRCLARQICEHANKTVSICRPSKVAVRFSPVAFLPSLSQKMNALVGALPSLCAVLSTVLSPSVLLLQSSHTSLFFASENWIRSPLRLESKEERKAVVLFCSFVCVISPF